jgi:uncharacterized protein
MTPDAASPAPVFTASHGRLFDPLRWVARLPRLLLLGLIRVYQHTFSPLLPIVTLGRCACRFAPTCSHYAAEAIQMHGAARGTLLAVLRLAKCTPLHPGGIDPVPPRRAPRCTRVEAASP